MPATELKIKEGGGDLEKEGNSYILAVEKIATCVALDPVAR